METGVARRNVAARSTTWNSGRLRIISTIRWPGRSPAACNPAATPATWSRSCRYVVSSHPSAPSPTIRRKATTPGFAAAVRKNAFGSVSPATTALISADSTA